MSSGKSNAILLDWARTRISSYKSVQITDFAIQSWRNGIALCAIVHSYNEKHFDFKSLDVKDQDRNMRLALDAAEKMGIPKMLDLQEMSLSGSQSSSSDYSDSNSSLVAYLSSMYRILEKGEKMDAGTIGLKKESDQAKAKLINATNELKALQDKLSQSREAMKQKEYEKKRLERQVETLKLQLNSEKKNN